jgi:predicted nuclease of predicted toxin-antitoxin system
MRVLLDECLDVRLRRRITGHDIETARHAGLAGLQNGRLLSAAEAAGFEVLLTADQNMPHQQNLTGHRIALLILCPSRNRLGDLDPLVPAVLRALERIEPGQIVRISR